MAMSCMSLLYLLRMLAGSTLHAPFNQIQACISGECLHRQLISFMWHPVKRDGLTLLWVLAKSLYQLSMSCSACAHQGCCIQSCTSTASVNQMSSICCNKLDSVLRQFAGCYLCRYSLMFRLHRQLVKRPSKAGHILFLSDVDCILTMARARRTCCAREEQLCWSLVRIRPYNVQLLVYLVSRGQREVDACLLFLHT